MHANNKYSVVSLRSHLSGNSELGEDILTQILSEFSLLWGAIWGTYAEISTMPTNPCKCCSHLYLTRDFLRFHLLFKSII